MKFKNYFNENPRVSVSFTKPSLTDQSQQIECDINYIIERYVKTGDLPVSPMQYMDTTTVTDYQDACYLVAEAKSAYENLPAKLRDKFKSVESYLDFISKEENLKFSVDNGLINADSVPRDVLAALDSNSAAAALDSNSAAAAKQGPKGDITHNIEAPQNDTLQE